MCPVQCVTYVSGRSQKSCTNFAATNEGAKGHVFAPFLHPFLSIRAVFTSLAFTGLTTLTRVRWSSFQKRRPAQGPLLVQRVLLARLPACKPPAAMLAAWMALEKWSFSLVDPLDFIVTVNKGIEPADCWMLLPRIEPWFLR